MKKQHWQEGLVTMTGVWLVASPWILIYSSPDTVGLDTASWNFIIVGALLFFLGFIALTTHWLWQEWIDITAAVWLIVSPWALHYEFMPAAMWNAIICGLTVIVISGWVLFSEPLTHDSVL